MICVHDFVANLSRTLSQSRRNGIWALRNACYVTEYAAYSLKSHVKPCVYISTSGCTELCYVTRRETSLVVGSRVTIAQLETVLTDLCSRLPGTHALLFKGA